MRLFAAKEEEDNPAFLTPWSIPHFLAGSAAKEIGIFNLLWWEILHGAYEVKDQIMNNTEGGNKNSLFNSIGDQAVTTAGWLLVNRKGYVGKWTLFFLGSWVAAVTLDDDIG